MTTPVASNSCCPCCIYCNTDDKVHPAKKQSQASKRMAKLMPVFFLSLATQAAFALIVPIKKEIAQVGIGSLAFGMFAAKVVNKNSH